MVKPNQIVGSDFSVKAPTSVCHAEQALSESDDRDAGLVTTSGAPYRAETERGNGETTPRIGGAESPMPRSVSVHPLHVAGRYFACDPEQDWTADLNAEKEEERSERC